MLQMSGDAPQLLLASLKVVAAKAGVDQQSAQALPRTGGPPCGTREAPCIRGRERAFWKGTQCQWRPRGRMGPGGWNKVYKKGVDRI